MLGEDDDQQVDGTDVAWEDDGDGDEDEDGRDGGESPEFGVDDVDEEPEERRVRSARILYRDVNTSTQFSAPMGS